MQLYYNGEPVSSVSDVPEGITPVIMEVEDDKIKLRHMPASMMQPTSALYMSKELAEDTFGISQEIIERVIDNKSNIITKHFEISPPTEEAKARLKKVLEIRAKCRKK